MFNEAGKCRLAISVSPVMFVQSRKLPNIDCLSVVFPSRIQIITHNICPIHPPILRRPDENGVHPSAHPWGGEIAFLHAALQGRNPRWTTPKYSLIAWRSWSDRRLEHRTVVFDDDDDDDDDYDDDDKNDNDVQVSFFYFEMKKWFLNYF